MSPWEHPFRSVNRLRPILTTTLLLLPLLLSSCSDKWSTAASLSSLPSISFHAHGSTSFDDCFLSSLPTLISALDDSFSSSCPFPRTPIPIEVRLVSSSFAAGYFLPRLNHNLIGIVASQRQLAVFAHEYIRHLCYTSTSSPPCCNWAHPSSSWSGLIGDQWQLAESLAYNLCG